MSNLILNDSMGLTDNKPFRHKNGSAHSTLWARTEVIGGYGRYTDNKGISQLGEVIFKQSNMVPIGGVQYAMEKLFNVRGPIVTGYISSPGSEEGGRGVGSPSTTQEYPEFPYSPEHCICLFGCGIGGAGENSTSAFDVDYKIRDLTTPIPFIFREEGEVLNDAEQTQYFGKKSEQLEDGRVMQAYYLKRFLGSDGTKANRGVQIKHLWMDGINDEDGTNVAEGSETVFNSQRTTAIESFAEINLKITKKDFKEYFEAHGMAESARINELALYAAELDVVEGDDYKFIKLFSKLNFNTEPLSTTKDLDIIYRVYGS